MPRLMWIWINHYGGIMWCRHVDMCIMNFVVCIHIYIYMYLCPCVCVLYRMSLHSARINAFVENYISNEKEVQIFVRCLREVIVHEIDSKIDLHYIDFTRFHFACVFPKKFCIYTVCIVCIITVYTYYMYIYIYIIYIQCIYMEVS